MSDVSSSRGIGRPPVVIDEELLERFLAVRMPLKQVARYFSTTETTLWNRYRDLINKHYTLYDFAVRAKQLELAEAGSEKMLMFLGKTTIEDRQTENAPINASEETFGVKWVVEAPKPVTKLTESEKAELESTGEEE